jgi:PAS domain S-box-containing protein
VLLLDLSLPDSSGVETLLTARLHAPNIAILVLTGWDDETLGIQAAQMGAQDYLVKGEPDSRLLRRAIRYAWERNRVEQALRRVEESYRSLIEDVFRTSVVGVLILDANYQVVWMNEAIGTYFGLDGAQLLGHDMRDLVERKVKCILQGQEEYASRILGSYRDNTYEQRFECRVLPEGKREERWLEYWSQPIRSGMYAGGRIEQYLDITLRKQLEAQEHEQRILSQALADTAIALTSTLDMDEVLAGILANIERVIPHDLANVMLVEKDEVYVAGRRGYDATNMPTDSNLHVHVYESPLLSEMTDLRRPIVFEDLDVVAKGPILTTYGMAHSYIGVPIVARDEILGFINIFSFQQNFFTAAHAHRAEAFAAQASAAIQNAKLFRSSRELAVAEERQRLARELHDSVTQTLFSSSVMIESALRQWDANPEKAHALAAQCHQLTRNALAEMRLLLLELRPSALLQASFGQLIEQLADLVQKRGYFELEVDVSQVPKLPGEAQIALYRIVQEALNNATKHSQATQVRLTARHEYGTVVMTIEDNGNGFDPGNVPVSSLGLGMMRERAEQVGASIEFESRLGGGTRVTVRWASEEIGQIS